MRLPLLAVQHVRYDEGGGSRSAGDPGHGEQAGGFHLDSEDALGAVPDDLFHGLPVRRVGGPRWAVGGSGQRFSQPCGEARVGGGEGLRRPVVMGCSLVPERGGTDHEVAGGQPLVDRAGGTDADEYVRAARGQLFDGYGRRWRPDGEPGKAQVRRQPYQQRANPGAVQRLVIAAFPHPVFQAGLPGEHHGARCRGPRVAQRLVVIQQAPRRHVRPAGVLSFEIREWHADMMSRPLTRRETISAERLHPGLLLP